MINFDLRHTFFSRRGAYLSFSITDREMPDGLYLRHLRGGILQSDLFRLDLVQADRMIPASIQATPLMLRLSCPDGEVQIFFETEEALRITGNGVALRLTRNTVESPFDCALPRGNSRWETNAYRSELKCLFVPLQGQVDVAAPWNGMKADQIVVTLSNEGAPFDFSLQTYRSTALQHTPASTDAAVARLEADFTAWYSNTLPVPAEWEQARMLAAYLNWAGMVAAEGNLTRPAMFMSKNWMNKIWGWDNCFNAIAHVQQDPQLAWDQLMLFVDNQGADGALPDHITDSTCSFRFYKPPVYGWALRQMQARTDWIDAARLAEIYPALCRWTDWWFTYRDDDGDGLPQYNHGNESGWDNGTPFACFLPIESPDLATFLILQMDFLAETAVTLGQDDAAKRWAARAERLLTQLLDHLWNGRQFIARHAHTHKPAPMGSLLLFLPLLLGERLPLEVRTALVAGLQRFLTAYGLATEQLDSPYYVSDGYWRGPIWAPSTYLLVDGLRQCGETDLADEISRRFCRMAAQSGMAENFDALTGFGLRDRAYTWTSGVFLLLATALEEKAKLAE